MLIAVTAMLAASLAPPPTAVVPDAPPALDAPRAMDDAEASLQKLEDKWNSAMEEYRQLVRDAKPEDRGALRSKAPQADQYAPEFMGLAKKYPKTAVAERALAWVAKNSRNAKFTRPALETLIDEHIESALIGDLLSGLERDYLDGPGLLQRVLDESPHAAVKGQAAVSLGKNLKSAAEIAEGLKAGMKEMYLGWYGAEVVEALSAVDPSELSEAAIEALSRAAEEFGELKSGRSTIAKAVAGDLFELENLWFGQIAPEIEAEDIDGVTFKLSDYRGKVVTLDFWGNW